MNICYSKQYIKKQIDYIRNSQNYHLYRSNYIKTKIGFIFKHAARRTFGLFKLAEIITVVT